ncbi:MAG: FAD-dependent oxidoreductase, partial [Actinomycetota bacterium]
TTDDPAEESVPTDAVVVCVGRRPNTEDLGLEVVGVTVDATGRIPVDAGRRTSRRILAIGDVTDGPALAHKATAEAEVAARTAVGIPARFDVAAIPAVVFSDPELATVGLTKAQAAEAGLEVTSFVFPLGASSRARTLADGSGPIAGHMELIADGDGTVIGAHLAGPHVSELIGEAALAIEMAATVEELAATVHPHPTMSEGLLEAAHGTLGLPLHVAAPLPTSTT